MGHQVVGLYITTLLLSLILIYHHHGHRDKLSPYPITDEHLSIHFPKWRSD